MLTYTLILTVILSNGMTFPNSYPGFVSLQACQTFGERAAKVYTGSQKATFECDPSDDYVPQSDGTNSVPNADD